MPVQIELEPTNALNFSRRFSPRTLRRQPCDNVVNAVREKLAPHGEPNLTLVSITSPSCCAGFFIVEKH